MKNSVLITAFLLIISAPLTHANEKLAMLDDTQAIAYTQFIYHQAKPSKSLRSYLVKARLKDTQEDFNAIMRKNHPENYQMMTSLSADAQLDVYTSYKRGERIKSLRKQVITHYSNAPGK